MNTMTILGSIPAQLWYNRSYRHTTYVPQTAGETLDSGSLNVLS